MPGTCGGHDVGAREGRSPAARVGVCVEGSGPRARALSSPQQGEPGSGGNPSRGAAGSRGAEGRRRGGSHTRVQTPARAFKLPHESLNARVANRTLEGRRPARASPGGTRGGVAPPLCSVVRLGASSALFVPPLPPSPPPLRPSLPPTLFLQPSLFVPPSSLPLSLRPSLTHGGVRRPVSAKPTRAGDGRSVKS